MINVFPKANKILLSKNSIVESAIFKEIGCACMYISYSTSPQWILSQILTEELQDLIRFVKLEEPLADFAEC